MVRKKIILTGKKKLNLLKDFDESQPFYHQGQNGEALLVESLYELNKERKNISKYLIQNLKEFIL